MYQPNAGQSTMLNCRSVLDVFLQIIACRAILWASVLTKAFHFEVMEKSQCKEIREEGGATLIGRTEGGCSYE